MIKVQYREITASKNAINNSLALPICSGYLFLGSRLGNSLLLKYTSREAGQVHSRLVNLLYKLRNLCRLINIFKQLGLRFFARSRFN